MKRIANGTSRGLALLFVNEYFDTEPDRIGAEAEIKNLIKMTTEMGLSQCIFKDKTSDEVKRILSNLSQLHIPRVRNTHDFIFIAFSSHGCNEGIKFRDNEIVPYMELINYLNTSNCPLFIGKPKIFFINCCRNDPKVKNPLETLRTDIPTYEPTTDLSSRVFHHNQLCNDSFSDTLVFFSCEPNKASIRDAIRGSIPIEILTKTYCQHANTHDFIEIFNEASNKLAVESQEMGLSDSFEFPIEQRMCVECNTLRYNLQIPTKECCIRPIDSINFDSWQDPNYRIPKANYSSNKAISTLKLRLSMRKSRKPYGRRGKHFTSQFSNTPIRSSSNAKSQCSHRHSFSVHNTQHNKDHSTFHQNLLSSHQYGITGWGALHQNSLSSNNTPIMNNTLTSYPQRQAVHVNTSDTYDTENPYSLRTESQSKSDSSPAILHPSFEDLNTEKLFSVFRNYSKCRNNKRKRLF